MDANAINELKNGLRDAYINGSLAEEVKKVISSVEDELLRCE